MLKPPFRLATAASVSTLGREGAGADLPPSCCEPETLAEPAAPAVRPRLADLDPHLHCSVIGTCMSTGELRKLMARFLFVRDASDLEVHHEAVRLAAQGGPVVKALHKALDQRHEAIVRRFSRVHDAAELTVLWDEALRHGEIPGAYWAILTHREVSAELRQKAFGDVHMLSHLVGAANRADIRRLVALERENEELRERAERQQIRSQDALDERDRLVAGLQQELAEAKASRPTESGPVDVLVQMVRQDLDGALALVAVQTERRERAEQQAGAAEEESRRLRSELEHLGQHVQALNRELHAAETQLREIGEGADASSRSLAMQLQGQRVFYVGGRPSSTPSIRDLVTRHGGEFQHHDGGLEDRKGLLAAGVAWAQLVVFPVDCVDHDSAGNLKRLCARQGIAYLPLRSASVASFAAALANAGGDDDSRSGGPGCRKHA